MAAGEASDALHFILVTPECSCWNLREQNDLAAAAEIVFRLLSRLLSDPQRQSEPCTTALQV